MSAILKEQELSDIITGATFFGAGGGGSPMDGHRLLTELKSQGKARVAMIKYQELPEDEYAVMIAEFGSPKAFLEASSFPETIKCFEVMQEIVRQTGKKITHIMAGELGGFNTMVPLYVAALKRVPFVDADAQGRAVPELKTSLYQIYEVSHSPFTMAGYNGDSIIAQLDDPMDYSAAENIARHISMAYGMRAGFCGLAANTREIAKLVPDSVSLCMAVGKVFREAGDVSVLSKALGEKIGAKVLFSGIISGIELKSEGGFDFGITHIKGTDGYAEKSISISFKNENMLLRDDTGKVLGTVPDIISVVENDYLKPLTNADTETGQRVIVFGTSAPANWLKMQEGYTCWSQILDKLNYQGDYVSVL